LTNSLHGLDWQKLPVHPIRRASVVIGASEARVYALLKTGELTAVKLGGKTLIHTASLIDYLAKAQPWKPDHDRVVRAVAARPDVARKAANLNRIAKAAARSGAQRHGARGRAAL
jgi:excisionase family DNA binding protein